MEKPFEASPARRPFEVGGFVNQCPRPAPEATASASFADIMGRVLTSDPQPKTPSKPAPAQPRSFLLEPAPSTPTGSQDVDLKDQAASEEGGTSTGQNPGPASQEALAAAAALLLSAPPATQTLSSQPPSQPERAQSHVPQGSPTPTLQQADLPQITLGTASTAQDERGDAAPPPSAPIAPGTMSPVVPACANQSDSSAQTGSGSGPVTVEPTPDLPAPRQPGSPGDPVRSKDLHPDGTSLAQTDFAMKATKFSEQFTGGGEQNLPKSRLVLAESAGDAAQPVVASKPATITPPSTPEVPSQLIADWNRIQQSGAAAPVMDTSTIPGSAQANRIAHMVATETALLVAHRADSLAVVIRPDAHTELFLQLRQNHGQIEAFVRCERGDIQSLNACWSDLQERLARQDIRLCPLQGPMQARDDSDAPSGKGTTSGDRSSRKRRAPDDAEDLPMVGSITEPLRRPGRPRSQRAAGWESWA